MKRPPEKDAAARPEAPLLAAAPRGLGQAEALEPLLLGPQRRERRARVVDAGPPPGGHGAHRIDELERGARIHDALRSRASIASESRATARDGRPALRGPDRAPPRRLRSARRRSATDSR